MYNMIYNYYQTYPNKDRSILTSGIPVDNIAYRNGMFSTNIVYPEEGVSYYNIIFSESNNMVDMGFTLEIYSLAEFDIVKLK